MKITVTGHRPNKFGTNNEVYNIETYDFYKPIKENMKKFINKGLSKLKPDEKLILRNGGAIGIDQLFWIVSIEMKELYPDKIEIELFVPCLKQESKWRKSDVDRYNSLKEKTDRIIMCSEKLYNPYLRQMQNRNEKMVEDFTENDRLLAVWNGTPGGTFNCLNAAFIKNITVIQLQPVTLKFKKLTEEDFE